VDDKFDALFKYLIKNECLREYYTRRLSDLSTITKRRKLNDDDNDTHHRRHHQSNTGGVTRGNKTCRMTATTSAAPKNRITLSKKRSAVVASRHLQNRKCVGALLPRQRQRTVICFVTDVFVDMWRGNYLPIKCLS
jgi:hypothetical protein